MEVTQGNTILYSFYHFGYHSLHSKFPVIIHSSCIFFLYHPARTSNESDICEGSQVSDEVLQWASIIETF